MTHEIRVHAFRGGSSFPLRAALESGAFAREGLDVRLSFTTSSPELMQGLLDGAFEVVQASPDNFVAWRDRTRSPIVAWYGGSNGPICCVVRPEVTSLAELRGARIAVDAPNTGWAPILLRLLAAAGVGAGEFTQVATGATAQVYDALVTGRTPAAMLNEPWASRAVRLGCRVAADHRSVAPGLQTSAGASLAGWLHDNRGVAIAFMRAIIAATAWLRHPTRHEATRALLADHLGASPEEADAVFARLADPDAGWPATAAIDPLGIETVRELRSHTAGRSDEPTSAYVDMEIGALALS